jgi:hypothetical protein
MHPGRWRVPLVLALAMSATGQNSTADPAANPWCSVLDISRNPGSCTDVANWRSTALRPALGGTSLKKIAKTWNRLTSEFKEDQENFMPDENTAINAILMQIQGALLSVGLVPEPGGKAQPRLDYLSQLVPNTEALARFLERKRQENPKIKAFAQLKEQAKALADQVQFASPVTSIKRLQRESPK